MRLSFSVAGESEKLRRRISFVILTAMNCNLIDAGCPNSILDRYRTDLIVFDSLQFVLFGIMVTTCYLARQLWLLGKMPLLIHPRAFWQALVQPKAPVGPFHGYVSKPWGNQSDVQIFLTTGKLDLDLHSKSQHCFPFGVFAASSSSFAKCFSSSSAQTAKICVEVRIFLLQFESAGYHHSVWRISQ